MPPGGQPKLQDPHGSDEQYENRTGDSADQERERERDVSGRTEELHLDVLAVLGDEDDEQDQEDDRGNQSGPQPPGPRPLCASKALIPATHAAVLPAQE
jgi:hypothetical protein